MKTKEDLIYIYGTADEQNLYEAQLFSTKCDSSEGCLENALINRKVLKILDDIQARNNLLDVGNSNFDKEKKHA